MADHHYEHQPVEPVETPVSVSRFFHTIRAYLPMIALSLAAVLIGYLLIAVLLYLLAPSQRITSQRFRLDFSGASAGKYPNGTKFAATEIINSPILLQTWQQNDLQRFVGFNDFSRAIFILESNTAYEELAAAYQARLADPKLTPVDRERIQREFELKRESLAKNEYSINFVQTRATAQVPQNLVRKSLNDILTNWANFAANEQHVLDYRVSVLSPSLLDAAPVEQTDLVAGVQILRSKIARVLTNISDIATLPAAEMARTNTDKVSLADLRVRFEEILRFRLEPLVPLIHASGLVDDSASTMRFLQAQLAYDERHLEAMKRQAEGIRQSLAVYSGSSQLPEGQLPSEGTGATPAQRSETVMPQLSETFLDRVLALANSSADTDYRQRLVSQYRDAIMMVIPAEAAVAYDRQLIEEMRRPVGGATADDATVRRQLEATRAEVKTLVVKVNEIYKEVSGNLNPSTQLFTVMGPPLTRVERTIGLSRILLWGIAVFLLALPTILVAVLLHARMTAEERSEAEAAHDASEAAATATSAAPRIEGAA